MLPEDSGIGGGLVCDSSDVALQGCRFLGNTAANYGGGAWARRSVIELTDCVFQENSAADEYTGFGGGVALDGNQSILLMRCTFQGNVAGWGSGFMLWGPEYPSTCTFNAMDCRFEDNWAEWEGGALWIAGITGMFGIPPEQSSLFSFAQCRFLQNRSGPAGFGGASDAAGASLDFGRFEFHGCDFVGNHATQGDGFGHGGAIKIRLWAESTFNQCLFSDNRAEWGGAIYQSQSALGTMDVRSCTLVASSGYEGGGAIYSGGAQSTLENCIIAFTQAGEAVRCDLPFALDCCDLYGNAGGDWVDCIAEQSGEPGNISLDPLFCNPTAGDYGLQSGSPCAPFSSQNPECDLVGARPVTCR